MCGVKTLDGPAAGVSLSLGILLSAVLSPCYHTIDRRRINEVRHLWHSTAQYSTVYSVAQYGLHADLWRRWLCRPGAMIDCDRSADAADEADTLRPQTRQALDEIVSELQQRYSERGGFISSRSETGD